MTRTRVPAAGLLLLLAACSDRSKPAHGADTNPDASASDTGASTVSAPGWQMYGSDLANSQVNPQPGLINRESVGRLGEKWHILIGAGATGTPVLADGTLYFGGWDGFFYAVDSASGAQRWKVRLGRQYVRSTPLVTPDRVYVAADASLFAVSRSDGKTLFETPLIDHPQGFIESSPKLADGVIVIGLAGYELNLTKENYTFEGAVVGIDAELGRILWKVPVTGSEPGPCMGGSGVSVWSSAAIDRELGLAYIGTGQTYEQPASTCNDSLIAIHYNADHAGERFAWKATFTTDDVYVAAGGGLNGLDHDIGAAPNLFRAGDVDAVGVGDKGGSYRAFDRKTGAELWRADLAKGMTAQLGGVMTTAAVQGDTIFVASNTWRLFGFITTGMHVAIDTATLYALDAKLGTPRWTQPLDAPVFGSFALSNGVLFHPTIRGQIYARDVETGQELWKADVGGPIGSGINVSDDSVYVSAGFALGGRLASGRVVGYALSPAASAEVDLREDTYKELSVEQCEAALQTLRPDAACRSCLCNCNPSTSGTCQAGCWEQAPCVVDNCATISFDNASGPACYTDHCSSKLLPPNVFQESLRAAKCMISCASSCGLAPPVDAGTLDGGVDADAGDAGGAEAGVDGGDAGAGDAGAADAGGDGANS
jgi:polyvinyl alcohol dehydrogenase (cytochrome)